jgi:hypothetical protein
MKERKILVPQWLWVIMMIMLLLFALSTLFMNLLPEWVNKWQVSRLEYSVEKLIDGNVSEKEWMDNSFLDFKGRSIKGSYYYNDSKTYSLEAALHFGNGCSLRQKRGTKRYSNYEQFSPILFTWQCEFDSIHGALFSYKSEDKVMEWYTFLINKLDDKEVGYSIKYLEAFEDAFTITYRYWAR